MSNLDNIDADRLLLDRIKAATQLDAKLASFEGEQLTLATIERMRARIQRELHDARLAGTIDQDIVLHSIRPDPEDPRRVEVSFTRRPPEEPEIILPPDEDVMEDGTLRPGAPDPNQPT